MGWKDFVVNFDTTKFFIILDLVDKDKIKKKALSIVHVSWRIAVESI